MQVTQSNLIKSRLEYEFDKSLLEEPSANIKLNCKRVNSFPLKSGTRQACSFLPLLLKTVIEVLARASKQENKVKCIQIGKEEAEFFTDDMVLYIENVKESTYKKK